MPISVKNAAGTDTSLATPEELQGTALTGETIATGSGTLGWLSSLRKTIVDRLPASLGKKADTASLSVTLATSETVPVTGTFWQATQPVSGTVTSNAGTGTQAVSLASVPSHAVTNAGTFAVQPEGSILADAVDSTNPLGVGGRASVALPTAVSADGDRVKGWFDLLGAFFVRDRPFDTATHSNVAAATSSTTLLAANTSRGHVTLWNDSSSNMYIKYGSTASATSCLTIIPANGYWEMPKLYRGIITGIWVAATGAARMTELT